MNKEQAQQAAEEMFSQGDRVVYFYTHHLNSKSSFTNSKMGVVVRKVKNKGKYVVKIDGNKGFSTISSNSLGLIHKKGIFQCKNERVTEVKCEYQCSFCSQQSKR